MTMGRPNKGVEHVDKVDAGRHEKDRLKAILRTVTGELSVQDASQPFTGEAASKLVDIFSTSQATKKEQLEYKPLEIAVYILNKCMTLVSYDRVVTCFFLSYNDFNGGAICPKKHSLIYQFISKRQY